MPSKVQFACQWKTELGVECESEWGLGFVLEIIPRMLDPLKL